LNRSDLVVRRHDRHQDGVGPDGGAERLGVHAAGAIHGQEGEFETFLPAQVLQRVQDGMVFDRSCDQMTAAIPHHAGCTEQRLVDAFGAAGREDQFAGLASKHRAATLPGLVQQGAGFASHVMNA